MKKFLFSGCLLLLVMISEAQKIFSDQTDPFTKLRTITTDDRPLVKKYTVVILMYGISAHVQNDSLTDFNISFLTPDVGAILSKDDSIKGECLLMADNNQILTGKYVGDAKFMEFNSSTYQFTKTQALQIASSKSTDVKYSSPGVEHGTFHIDADKQDKIAKALQLILNKIRSH